MEENKTGKMHTYAHLKVILEYLLLMENLLILHFFVSVRVCIICIVLWQYFRWNIPYICG